MLRLAHRILQGPVIAHESIEKYKKTLMLSHCIIADNIAEYLYATEMSSFDMQDFANCRLPFSNVWIEWIHEGYQCGCLCQELSQAEIELIKSKGTIKNKSGTAAEGIVGGWKKKDFITTGSGKPMLCESGSICGFDEQNTLIGGQVFNLSETNVELVSIFAMFAPAYLAVSFMNFGNVTHVDVTETEGP